MKNINRKQRRAFDAALKMKGAGRLAEAMQSETVLHDGDKVRIKAEQITARQDFAGKTQKYKEWLYANSEQVFTAHRVYPDERHSLIELEEDKTEPKWLWWDGDLERVECVNESDV